MYAAVTNSDRADAPPLAWMPRPATIRIARRPGGAARRVRAAGGRAAQHASNGDGDVVPGMGRDGLRAAMAGWAAGDVSGAGPTGGRVRAALALALLALALLPWPGRAQSVRTEHVTAELVSAAAAVQPGSTARIGLRLRHIPHWHTYWRNPGDSGLPTTLTWKALPEGVQAGEIEWPAPQRLPIGPLVNYGYEGDLLLPLALQVQPGVRPGSTLRLQADAEWLVCNDVCIPENATLTLELPVAEPGVTPGQTALAPMFERAAAARAVPMQGWTAELQHAGGEALLTLRRAGGAAAATPLPTVHVFPYTEQLVEPAHHELYRSTDGYALKLTLAANATLPARFDGIAVIQGPEGAAVPALWGGPQRSGEFSATVRAVDALQLPAGAERVDDAATGGAAGTRSSAGGTGTATAAPAGGVESLGGGQAPMGLVAALLLALVGGMVLNLMPCVFPVLSIKLLSLAQQQGERPAALRAHALAYGAGVVVSFLALALLLLGLRAAGSAVGWGFQLQEPGVVFALALLFFMLALNLLGGFEFGQLLPSGLAGWRARRPSVDAFGSGVLAVLAASPCTAPFMGAALGYAITQSPAASLAVFGALGVGMALPYMALAVAPGWRARLPRPGPWMLRLKQGLAFPLFATVVWLVWVLGQQAGIDGAAKVLLALVGVAFAVWLAGAWRARRATPPEGASRGLAGGVAGAVGAAVLTALLAWSWPGADAQARAAGSAAATDAAAGWQPYSDAALAARLAQGQPVFVDFTAAWCVSCQVNKRLVLSTADTQAAFAAAGVALMRADWTSRDAEITAALARLGRNGVPVYALLRPGREPLLLPEILTPGLVRDALARL